MCSGPRGRTQREGYATRRRPGWDGGKNAGGWRGRTAHGPAKDARVQANILKVPAHVRSNHQTRGTTEPGKISAGIYSNLSSWNNNINHHQ